MKTYGRNKYHFPVNVSKMYDLRPKLEIKELLLLHEN